MSCGVSEEQLWSWLDRGAAELDEHLAVCPACRARADELRGAIRTVRVSVPAARPQLPERIGSYAVRRLLGEGGMGLVYEAEQQHPRRTVALKVVRGGRFVDAHYLKLFQREVQTLARLKHPGIAAIYEAGCTEDGQHFFAMELVQGVPLTDYARGAGRVAHPLRGGAPSGNGGRGLPTEARVRLFGAVCEAINYAHQRGVIHRDLKPSNIMVDADGLPKVLDFGLARITDADVAVTTVVTETGRIAGTLPYMSPEQVRGNAAEIDVRSDVYSLGVILYELLTGSLPYAVSKSMIPDAIRVICEQPPRRPSTILRALRGDLETIVLKALEKEPQRRYASAAFLKEDLGRYLARQPIHARPPSAAYQFRKFTARHKAPVALAATLLVLLAGFGVWTGALYLRADRLRRAAEREAEKARTSFVFLTEVLSSGKSTRGHETTILEALAEADREIETKLGAYPDLESAVRMALGKVYLAQRVPQAAEQQFRAVVDIRRRLYGEEHPEVAAGLLWLARALRSKRDLDGAQELNERALAMQRRLLGDGDPAVADTLKSQAMVLKQQGRLEEAEQALRQGLAIQERTGRPEAITLCNLAMVLHERRRVSEARRFYERAIALLEEDQSLGLASALNGLGCLLREAGDLQAAEPYLRRAHQLVRDIRGPTHPLFATASLNLARLLRAKGDQQAARIALREALTIRRDRLAEDDPKIADTLLELGDVSREVGDHGSAEQYYRELLRLRREEFPEQRVRLATVLYRLGLTLMETGHLAEAEPVLRECLQIRREALPPTGRRVGEAMSVLGDCLARRGKFDEAEPLLLDGHATIAAADGESHPRSREALERIVRLYESRYDAGEAALWRANLDFQAEVSSVP